jgi:hypothetical protein
MVSIANDSFYDRRLDTLCNTSLVNKRELFIPANIIFLNFLI